jgi:hypothetical protein
MDDGEPRTPRRARLWVAGTGGRQGGRPRPGPGVDDRHGEMGKAGDRESACNGHDGARDRS